MFSLFCGYYKYLFDKPEINILILGIDNSGKTTLLNNIKHTWNNNDFPAYTHPTIGLNIGKIETKEKRVQFWDLGGSQSLRKIWNKYFPSSHALIFLCNLYDKNRYDDVIGCFENSLRKIPLDFPILLIYTKFGENNEQNNLNNNNNNNNNNGNRNRFSKVNINDIEEIKDEANNSGISEEELNEKLKNLAQNNDKVRPFREIKIELSSPLSPSDTELLRNSIGWIVESIHLP